MGLFLGTPQAKATPQGSTSVLTLFGICLQHTTNEGSGCHTVIHLACWIWAFIEVKLTYLACVYIKHLSLKEQKIPGPVLLFFFYSHLKLSCMLRLELSVGNICFLQIIRSPLRRYRNIFEMLKLVNHISDDNSSTQICFMVSALFCLSVFYEIRLVFHKRKASPEGWTDWAAYKNRTPVHLALLYSLLLLHSRKHHMEQIQEHLKAIHHHTECLLYSLVCSWRQTESNETNCNITLARPYCTIWPTRFV